MPNDQGTIVKYEALASPIVDWTLDREFQDEGAPCDCSSIFDWLPWAIAGGALLYGMSKR